MQNKTRFFIFLLMILTAMLLTVSCSKKMVQSDSTVVQEPQAAETPVQAPPIPETPKMTDNTAEEADKARKVEQARIQAEAAARETARRIFLDENIHFAFDSAVLSEEAQQILKNKADYLNNYPVIAVTVEGHCDERGTNDYNIALGELRAQTVKNYLVALGVGPDRLNTISYGEERPLERGHDEMAWAKNRRAQFLIN